MHSQMLAYTNTLRYLQFFLTNVNFFIMVLSHFDKHDVLKIEVLILSIIFFNYNLMIKINSSHFSFNTSSSYYIHIRACI